jgi:hypothetical protein
VALEWRTRGSCRRMAPISRPCCRAVCGPLGTTDVALTVVCAVLQSGAFRGDAYPLLSLTQVPRESAGHEYLPPRCLADLGIEKAPETRLVVSRAQLRCHRLRSLDSLVARHAFSLHFRAQRATWLRERILPGPPATRGSSCLRRCREWARAPRFWTMHAHETGNRRTRGDVSPRRLSALASW